MLSENGTEFPTCGGVLEGTAPIVTDFLQLLMS